MNRRIERRLQRVVGGDSEVRPRIGNAAVLRKRLQRLGDGPREIRKWNTDVGENGLGLGQRGGTQGLPQQRAQRDVLQRNLIGHRTQIAGARQEVAGTAAIGDAERQAGRDGVLDVEIPVLVIGRLAAEIGISESDSLRRARTGDGSPGSRRDKADAIARIDEGRRLESRIAAGPIERRLAGGDAAEGSARAFAVLHFCIKMFGRCPNTPPLWNARLKFARVAALSRAARSSAACERARIILGLP